MLYPIIIVLFIILTAFTFRDDPIVGAPVAVLAFFVSIPMFMSITHHAIDLGTLEAQKYVIEVQRKRVDSLKATLNSISLPKDSVALLNGDSPVSSMVGQLSIAESDLAKANSALAKARVSIAQRKHGLTSIVVTFMGEGEEL